MSADPRPVIEVACGVLLNARGEVLLAQRPEGKIAAGYWEFPGGKIEPGEAARAALVRELEEELGVVVREARPLIRLRHAYSNRIVVLDTWRVAGFDGQPSSRENQALAWVPLHGIAAYHTLPTVAPILPALRLPSQYVFTAPDADEAAIRAGLAALPAGALLRLRLPQLDVPAYARVAEALAPAVRAAGLRLVLDRDPQLSVSLDCGFHATAVRWQRLSQRPVPESTLFLASAHTRDDLLKAQALGADAAVLGHVNATASHPGAPALGWPAFAAAAREAGLPVYAIGGLGPAELAEAFEYGGQGVAGIGAYWT